MVVVSSFSGEEQEEESQQTHHIERSRLTCTMSDSTTTTTAAVADPRAVSRDVFSATIGSVCCCYTGQPFDTIKVRMQTHPAKYPSVLSTSASIFQNEVGTKKKKMMMMMMMTKSVQPSHTCVWSNLIITKRETPLLMLCVCACLYC